MSAVSFEAASKVYSDGTVALDGLDLAVADGEFMVLVGPSGCGKTTALRMVAGLEDVSRGAIRIGGQVVNDLDCGERDIAMVFQNYALYPHMSVRANLDFPLKLAGMSRSARAERIRTTARALGIEAHLDRRPGTLSGGQRQRVAMGRALVREPQVFLMDEPLSNLDAKLRVHMRGEIASLQRRLGITTIYVTHDQVEALTMGHRIAIMRGGVLQQVADPQTLYNAPANLFVAAFIGSPAMNIVEAAVLATNGAPELALGDQRIGMPHLSHAAKLRGEGPVVLGIRPESLAHAALPEPGRTLSGTVLRRESIGSDLLVTVGLAGAAALSAGTADLAQIEEERDEAGTLRDGAGMATLTARLPPDLPHRLDDPIHLAVPPAAIRLFDPATGQAIA